MRFYRRSEAPHWETLLKFFLSLLHHEPLFSRNNLFNFIGKRWGKKVDYILCQKKKMLNDSGIMETSSAMQGMNVAKKYL